MIPTLLLLGGCASEVTVEGIVGGVRPELRFATLVQQDTPERTLLWLTSYFNPCVVEALWRQRVDELGGPGADPGELAIAWEEIWPERSWSLQIELDLLGAIDDQTGLTVTGRPHDAPALGGEEPAFTSELVFVGAPLGEAWFEEGRTDDRLSWRSELGSLEILDHQPFVQLQGQLLTALHAPSGEPAGTLSTTFVAHRCGSLLPGGGVDSGLSSADYAPRGWFCQQAPGGSPLLLVSLLIGWIRRRGVDRLDR